MSGQAWVVRRTAALGLVWLVLVAVAPGAAAAEVRRGRHVTIPAGSTVAGGLAADGLTVELFGDVAGNLRVRAGYLNQVGAVAGDLTAAAGRAELRGAVGGSVRVTGGSVSLYGTIAGDVELTGGQLTLVEGSVVGGNVTVRGGSLTVVATARIGGNLTGQVAEAAIEGEVGRGVDLTVGRLSVAPGARIGGALRYESRAPARIDPAATVAGPVTRRDPAARLPYGAALLWRTAALPRFLLLLALGALAVLLRPGWATAVADAPRRAPATVALTGAGVALLAPVALLLLALPLVTLPLAAAGAAVYLAAAYFSMAVVGLALGRLVLRRPPDDRRRWPNLLALAAGAGALALARLAPIPGFGLLSAAVIAVVGLGALAANRWHLVAPSGEGRRAPHPWPSTVLGLLVGIAASALALAALGSAAVGGIAAIATASHSAAFVWTVAPARYGELALACALAAVVVLVLGFALARGRGASVPDG